MNADFAHLLARPQTVDWQAFGAALKAEIRARGLTLQQVSDEVRLSRATISREALEHTQARHGEVFHPLQRFLGWLLDKFFRKKISLL